MSQDKKDLTRIEDLGEFFHADSDSDESFELPELPTDALEAEESFEVTFETPATPAEDVPAEEASDEPFADTSLSIESSEPTEEISFESSVEESTTPSWEDNTTAFEVSSAPAEEDEETPTEESIDFGEEIPSSPLSTPELMPQESEVFTPKETFTDTREFADNATLSDGPAECNPAYSIIARNIRYVEDSEDILTLLKEVGFPEDMREQFQRQLSRGTLLIPRVSEFTAVYVCHRLRRFKLDLQMGPSDLLHPPKNKTEEDRGLVSRKSLGQNQQHHFNFKTDTVVAREILLSTLSQLDGFSIDNYLGVASEHAFLAAEIVESETTELIHKNYDELALKLKAHALEHKANAVLGINYQLTPMPIETSIGHYRYKLTCTGNLVWVSRLEA
jgi:uncharacterized protein YbjQ (UPF0145 family)